ncbi:splicing factor 3A subunit 3 [Pyrus ussuriensis x Pyrus communis]|uniref:Splicing factor 3A subunit 3 n=1 Tax=Pyrus ussuriensis x Pyrus communis TaxID=2448454 RepID=A0A5N5F6V5_9ROSA|nr:splicing factor 3A subunit 3 [Pyrus ussuriensis x Pyrus communis]
MSSTLLEQTRAAHEEVERLERLIVKDFMNEPPSSKDRLYQGHRVRQLIDTITSTTEKLIEIYEDKDNARKDEIAALGGQTATGTNVFSAFYDRLKEIREYHRKHPVGRVVDANEEEEALLKEEPQIEFSGEEAFGRYLDLHELYNQYINSKFGEPIEYSAYLDTISQPQKIPRKLKSSRQYREYMENLLAYLIYFFQRTEPLQDLDRIFLKVHINTIFFTSRNGHVQDQLTMIDLDYYSTVEELMEVGPEKLKEALASLGLKTGGTVQQRAERLFLTKDTPLEKLDKKHFAKGSRGAEQNGAAAAPQQVDNLKEIALLEAKTKKLCDLLSEAIERTRDNIMKKQALTYEEIEAEREEEETQADTESDDDEQQIYNPLKLPMGGMGSPFRTGCISFMVLVRNSSVRFAGITVTGDVELSRDILRNGAISMVCVALAYRTPRTSMRSHQLRKLKNSGRGYKHDKA